MRVNLNDFTFANTSTGSPVPYGTGGDCHGLSECHLGYMKINLTGTLAIDTGHRGGAGGGGCLRGYMPFSWHRTLEE